MFNCKVDDNSKLKVFIRLGDGDVVYSGVSEKETNTPLPYVSFMLPTNYTDEGLACLETADESVFSILLGVSNRKGLNILKRIVKDIESALELQESV